MSLQPLTESSEHKAEIINYLIIEQGSWKLPDGT